MSGPDSRLGLNAEFLGAPVMLPMPVDTALPTVLLDYVHFSVLMRPDRRLAAVTGVCIDGAQLVDLPRTGIDWRQDDRLPGDQQTGEALYARNDLDRGHLVRRADAVWGDEVDARAANIDTFHYTNAAPQAARFNQGDQLWLGLETYLLDHAAIYDRRMVVFPGPVLHTDDPLYRGVQIPLRFFKVAVFALDTAGQAPDRGAVALGATGYVLDQTPQVADLDEVLARTQLLGGPPPLGPFRTFQVPITDIAALSGLELSHVTPWDRLVASGVGPHSTPAPGQWQALASFADITL